jgi:hypothetical protein
MPSLTCHVMQRKRACHSPPTFTTALALRVSTRLAPPVVQPLVRCVGHSFPFCAGDDEEATLAMASSSPIHERPVFQSGFRRSVTLPPRALSFHERAGLDPSDSAADILYSHPAARIIKFSPPYSTIRSVSNPISQDLDYPVDTVETLPWASTTETTVASGTLIIEKVQGSTNFLKSGAVMHAILRNSQCWCVDGESRFVLRTGRFQYYRIELPTSNDDERAKVEELKELLKKILRFERTPCPFKRGFHVDLDESDITPRRKGTWKRRQSSQIPTSVGGTPSPLSRGKRSRTEAMHMGTPFHRDGQDESSRNGSSTNSSEFDEDDLRSEPDDYEERTSHLQVTSSPGPPVDRLHQPEGDDNESSHIGDDKTASVECISEQASGPRRDTPEMVLEDPSSAKACSSQEGTKQVSDVVATEPEVDSTEVNSSTAGASIRIDAEVDATEVDLVTAEASPKPDVEVDAAEGDSLTADTLAKPDVEVDATEVDLLAADASFKPDGEADAAEGDSSTADTPAKPDVEVDVTEVDLLAADTSLKPDAEVDTTYIDPLTAGAPLEPDTEVDATEADSFAAEASMNPDVGAEAASQATVFPSEPTSEELSPPAARAAEPALAETDGENAQTTFRESGEKEADDAEDDIEAEGDPRPIDTMSIASSTNSFHSLGALESPPSLSPPGSPPSPMPRAALLDPLAMHDHRAHKRELSELTIIPPLSPLEPLLDLATASPDRPSTSASNRPATPQLARPSTSDGSWTEVETPSTYLPTSQIRHRLKSRRSLSPLPPSPILYTPSPQQDRSNHLTSAILQKACSLALTKPVEVVVMLVHILARIAAGATVNDLLNGDLFRSPGQEREHQRNRNFPDHIDGNGDDGLDEDDFGVPLRGRSRRREEVINADDDTDSLLELD